MNPNLLLLFFWEWKYISSTKNYIPRTGQPSSSLVRDQKQYKVQKNHFNSLPYRIPSNFHKIHMNIYLSNIYGFVD